LRGAPFHIVAATLAADVRKIEWRRKKYAGDFLNKVTTFSAGSDLAAIENDTGIVGE
jgi:hypothetical protein